MGSGVGSRMGSGVGSRTGAGVSSLAGSGVSSIMGSGDGSRSASNTGSVTGSGVGSEVFSCTTSVSLDISSGAADGSTAVSAGGSGSSGLAMADAAVAIAAAAATAAAAAISFSGSATVAALGPRFTGVGVLVPTGFLGLEVLVVAVLEPGVLEASLEGVLLSCVLERFGVFVSATLLAVGFLAGTSDFEADLGVSSFAAFVVEDGRVRGDSEGFLDAAVADLVTSGGKTAEGMIKQ